MLHPIVESFFIFLQIAYSKIVLIDVIFVLIDLCSHESSLVTRRTNFLTYPMRTELKKSAVGGILLGACVMCVAGTAIAARPEQSVRGNAPKEVSETPSSAKTDAVKLNKTVVLAKNSNTKTASVAPATTAKPQASAEKKTIGRCWKRLMTMVREVRHAHTNNK
jgi:hypothetical protein